jgi:hypothetical protein
VIKCIPAIIKLCDENRVGVWVRDFVSCRSNVAQHTLRGGLLSRDRRCNNEIRKRLGNKLSRATGLQSQSLDGKLGRQTFIDCDCTYRLYN